MKKSKLFLSSIPVLAAPLVAASCVKAKLEKVYNAVEYRDLHFFKELSPHIFNEKIESQKEKEDLEKLLTDIVEKYHTNITDTIKEGREYNEFYLDANDFEKQAFHVTFNKPVVINGYTFDGALFLLNQFTNKEILDPSKTIDEQGKNSDGTVNIDWSVAFRPFLLTDTANLFADVKNPDEITTATSLNNLRLVSLKEYKKFTRTFVSTDESYSAFNEDEADDLSEIIPWKDFENDLVDAEVISWSDGDTFKVKVLKNHSKRKSIKEGTEYTIRFSSIDTPEKFVGSTPASAIESDFATKISSRFAQEAIKVGEKVRLVTDHTLDAYGRVVAEVFFGEKDGKFKYSYANEIVKHGASLPYDTNILSMDDTMADEGCFYYYLNPFIASSFEYAIQNKKGFFKNFSTPTGVEKNVYLIKPNSGWHSYFKEYKDLQEYSSTNIWKSLEKGFGYKI